MSMTKEEARLTLQENFGLLSFEYPGRISEAIKIALEELQLSLPSNLDEAANKFAVLYDQGTCDGIAQECFKAGAEWMAGQGISQEETVENKALGLGYGVLSGIDPIINLPNSFCPGEKVIVQIRKK